MSRFARSVSSEYQKVRSTNMWWILAIVLGAYSAMMSGLFAFVFGAMRGELEGTGVSLPSQQVANMIYASVSTFGYVIPLLFGALMATGELKHRTLGLAFTLEPKRGIVLMGKTIVLLGVGLFIGLVGLIGAVGAGAATLAATGGDPLLGSAETWAIFARIVAAIAIWAIIGFGVGVLVRSQAVAIVIALVFTQFLEPVLRLGAQVWDWSAQVAKFLPGAATDAFVGASVLTNLSALDPAAPQTTADLGIWLGLFVFVGYAAIVVVAGWLLRWRRDIT